MKKTLIVGLSVVAIMLLGTSLAMAYESPEEYVSPELVQGIQGPNFIDEDGDGICDLMGTGQSGQGQGYGPWGLQAGTCGGNFIDEDGDGVCDLAGMGQGFGPGGSQDGTCGDNFVDEDGDGVCDLAGSGQAGTGQGFGGRGRMGNGQGQGWGRNARGAGQYS